MPDLEALREFYRSELRPELERLEARRRERARAALLPLRNPWLWAACLLACLLLRSPVPLLLPGLVVAARAARTPLFSRASLKRDVVARVVRFCDASFRYRPQGRIADTDVRASGLFHEHYDAILGEDLVSGRVGATDFRFSELRLVNRGGKQLETIWSGVLFVADFNKSFRGRTTLLPDRAERLLGSLGRAFQQLPHFGQRLVELEDPGFERHFAVYATDETEARYILSPSLMQRLRRFRENVNVPLRIAFANQSVYVALPLETNLFDVPPTAGAIDERTVRTWVGEILFVTGLVEDLDLDTRIWSKPSAA